MKKGDGEICLAKTWLSHSVKQSFNSDNKVVKTMREGINRRGVELKGRSQ